MVHFHRLSLDFNVLLPLLLLAYSTPVLSVKNTCSECLYLRPWSWCDAGWTKMELILNLKLCLGLGVDVRVSVKSIAILLRWLLWSELAICFIVSSSSVYWASGVPLPDPLDSFKATLDSVNKVFALLLQINSFLESCCVVYHVIVSKWSHWIRFIWFISEPGKVYVSLEGISTPSVGPVLI